MSQPEARLQRRIQQALRREYDHDIFFFKIHGGPTMLAGLPDLVGVINGRFFGIEVKMPGENPTVRQMHIHRRIRESGGSVTVARSVPDALAFIRRVIARSHTQERVTGDLKASR